DKCTKTTFTGSSTVTGDQTGKITSLGGTWYGDCTSATATGTPSNRGYLYDWSAAMQKAGALYALNANVGCAGTVTGTTGTLPGACPGLCPEGWHIPTGAADGEYKALHDAIGGCVNTNSNCWNAASSWEGVLGGACSSGGTLYNQGSYAYYWSSTYNGTNYAYRLNFDSSNTDPGTTTGLKNIGVSVRCVRNY
ncbi:MAG: hypothetical protein LBT49_01580, partial [Prevotellaceae bacterium]|nr:hypothetical protein [Prevotellaceae bacterium]